MESLRLGSAVVLLVIFAVLITIPGIQLITVMATQTSNPTSNQSFIEHPELRVARAEKWLEWWVITLKRLLGISLD